MLRKTITYTLSAGVLVAALAQPSHAEQRVNPVTNPVEWCLVYGGEIIQMSPSMQACCADDGCVICDMSWNNCVFDPAYNQHAGTMTPHSVFPGQMTQTQPSTTPMTTQIPGLLAPLTTR